MAILKCKMCGGDLLIQPGKTFGTCEYCGCTMTLPKIDDDQRAAAFNRGNHFRRIGEFDKALAVYEHIIQEAPADAEAHWCCALCRFGIEYVEDPATYEYLPTCHRASFDSFLEDVDYLAALENSEGITRRQYQKDAAKIEEVRRGILTTSQSEEPFDIFICYKETDENGQRTKDSLMAQEIYYQLTDQGRRVFFARITLEDKVGSQYEPYIFAALNSAKVMICVGTKPEHFNAVWVKNEWSRFLALMKRDRSKLLLPCYRDMDPYDLPEQLAVLQSYDMAKIGFIQDLTRGINKVLTADAPAKPAQPAPVEVKPAAVNTEPILKRAFMFLEDGEWSRADDFCEQVLNQDPESAQAYLGKLMAELKVRKQDDLKNCAESFEDNGNYLKVIRFGEEALSNKLKETIKYIRERNETARKESIYNKAVAEMKKASDENSYQIARKLFQSISGFKDTNSLILRCNEGIENIKSEQFRLWNEVQKAITNHKNSTSTQNKFTELEKEISELEEYAPLAEKIQKMDADLVGLNTQKASLDSYKSGLGMFKFKEKKETDEKIFKINRNIDALQNVIGASNAKLSKYSSLDEVQKKLAEKKQQLAQYQAQVNSQRSSLTYSQAMSLCETNPYVRMKMCETHLDLVLPTLRQKSTLFFGHYRQSKNGLDRTPIEWIVLKVEKNKALILSKCILDLRKYDATVSSTGITWSICDMRRWLNYNFLSSAFTAKESEMIELTEVSVAKADDWGGYREYSSSSDRVFILSRKEFMDHYSWALYDCKETDYVREHSEMETPKWPNAHHVSWWLRTPGKYPYFAMQCEGGHIENDGHPVNINNLIFQGVRPAMWIKLD